MGQRFPRHRKFLLSIEELQPVHAGHPSKSRRDLPTRCRVSPRLEVSPPRRTAQHDQIAPAMITRHSEVSTLISQHSTPPGCRPERDFDNACPPSRRQGTVEVETCDRQFRQAPGQALTLLLCRNGVFLLGSVLARKGNVDVQESEYRNRFRPTFFDRQAMITRHSDSQLSPLNSQHPLVAKNCCRNGPRDLLSSILFNAHDCRVVWSPENFAAGYNIAQARRRRTISREQRQRRETSATQQTQPLVRREQTPTWAPTVFH
jgi:hypothetical protein